MEKLSALKAAPKLHSHNIFEPYGGIRIEKLYCSFFQTIPSELRVKQVDIKKAIAWIDGELNDKIISRSTHLEAKNSSHRVIYLLAGEILLHLDKSDNSGEILFSRNHEQVENIFRTLKKFPKRRSTGNLTMVTSIGQSTVLRRIKNSKLRLSLNKNYNEDLLLIHPKINGFLKKKESGLVLFHGEPGTGKSTYIRHLINHSTKKVIFIPPKLAADLDAPQIIETILDNPNSIVVIEDAEGLLASRDRENNSRISMLLNLTDGLLGASLNIQFICTFNTALQNIDKALLRKGRLKILYEFKPLSIEKSRALLDDLGKIEYEVSAAMTLADIYGASDAGFHFEGQKNKIGFNLRMA